MVWTSFAAGVDFVDPGYRDSPLLFEGKRMRRCLKSHLRSFPGRAESYVDRMAFQGRVAGGRIRQLSGCDRLVPSVDLVELKIPLEDCAADLGPESPAEPLIALQDGDEGDTTDEEATPIEDTDVGVELPGASLLLRAAAL